MNKISHLIVVILAIALALAACGGNIKSKSDTNTTTSTGTETGTDDPLVVFDEGDMESEDAAVPPVFWPTAIGDVTVECGRDFSKAINTKGGTGEISWKVNGLPAWAKAEPSDSSKNILRVSGLLPFEGCDIQTHKVSLKVCGSKGSACSENSFNIKTKIHGIRIETALSDTSAVIGAKPPIPELKAAGGSGNYSFTTTIPKELISEDHDKITNETNIKFKPKKIGSYTITVKAKDRVFDGRENEIADKMDISPDQVGTATKEFKVNVKEDGFIIQASLIDAAGTEKDKADSVAKQLDEKSFVVPYNGKMKIDINGEGEKYYLTIKSSELPIIDKKSVEITRGTPYEILFFEQPILAKVKELEENPIKITITAKNEAGDGETLKMERISFAKDPCESLDVGLSTEDHPDGFFTIERGSGSEPVVSLSVKGGKGPFFWNIPTEMKESLVDVETGVTVAPLTSTDLTDGPPYVDLNDFWGEYGSENRPANRETIKITRDTAYANINDKLNWDAKKDLDSFEQGTARDPIRVYEILNVSVTDNGCMKKVTHDVPITVEIPKPSQEKIENVKFAHFLFATDTFNGSDTSTAQIALYTEGDSIIGNKSKEKDIAAWCGETEEIKRWNWPPLDLITNTSIFLTDIHHLEVKTKQPSAAVWTMYHKIERFYVVGKNWVYFDDNEGEGYKSTIKDDGKDDIRCIPIGGKCHDKPAWDSTRDRFNGDTGGREPTGKWYLRSDPSSENSTWKNNENIKFDADGDTNVCRGS
ncbi:MAG: hypothetical protein GX659_06760 [Myxococcales bacterium]|nr:hypothetical protein [Myxococcales bacterium]